MHIHPGNSGNLLRRHVLLAGVGLAATACSKQEPPPSIQEGPLVVARPVDAPDLVAEAMLLPGLVNSSTDGPMIDLLKAIGSQYTGGSMSITAFPVGRVVADMESGAADLALGFLRVAPDVEARQKYRLSTEAYGQVSFVLYTRKSAPVRVRDILQAKSRPAGEFPYQIESPLLQLGFPVVRFNDMASAFKKLEAGHTHAFLWAQEEADNELRRQGLKDITRELFSTYDDVLAIPRGPRGDKVDAIITHALTALRASGELQKLYSKIHRPYDPWQP